MAALVTEKNPVTAMRERMDKKELAFNLQFRMFLLAGPRARLCRVFEELKAR
jgi:hypothetical protein